MGYGPPLFLLLTLLGCTRGVGPGLTLQLRLKESPPADHSSDTHWPALLHQLCLLLQLPSGTNVTVHHTGPPYRMAC